MKTLKPLILTVLFTLIGVSSSIAQESLTIPLSNPGKAGKLVVEVVFADNIRVQSHNKDHVIVSYDGDDLGRGKSNQKNGLRRISSGGLSLEVTERDNVVKVNSQPMNNDLELIVYVPKSFSVKINAVHGDIEVNNITGECEIESVNGDVELENINGSAIVNSVNGDITANFVGLNPKTPMSFTGVNGDIDLAFPADAKFSAKMKTDWGDVYTDFDMNIKRDSSNKNESRNNREYRVTINKWVFGTVNGGGPEFLVKTLHGDISIRKKI